MLYIYFKQGNFSTEAEKDLWFTIISQMVQRYVERSY